MVLIDTLWVETFIMSSLQTLGCLPYFFGGNHALFVFEKSSLMRCVCEMGLPERKLSGGRSVEGSISWKAISWNTGKPSGNTEMLPNFTSHPSQ